MAVKAVKTDVYTWEGKDRKGTKMSGELTGQSPALVKAQLRKQGINPQKVRKKSTSIFSKGKRIKPLDIALFTRQMATMLKAGVPLLQAFDIIGEGFDNPNMRKLVDEVKQEVAAGNSFAAALRKCPQYFDELYCNLVDAGEQAGALDTLLDRVATYKEKSEALKAKIKKAMTYPAAVVLVAAVVTGILLVKVVPQFESVFSGFGAKLPAFTVMVIGLSEIMQQWWWVMLGGAVGGFFWREVCAQAFGALSRLARQMAAQAAADRHLAVQIRRGPLRPHAVHYLRRRRAAGGGPGFGVWRHRQRGIQTCRAAHQAGGLDRHAVEFLHACLRDFPNLAVQMTAIGEESGALDDMLDKVASFYEAEVDNLVDNLTSLMEPFIMVVLGVVVGGLVVAMYLPIFQLGSAI